MGHKRDYLTQKQLRAISLELQGRSWLEITQRCGISESCLTKWHRRPLYKQTLSNYQTELLDGVLEVIKGRCIGAIDILETEMHTAEKSSDRIRAAVAMLSMVVKSHELTTLRKAFAGLENLKQAVEQIMGGTDDVGLDEGGRPAGPAPRGE